MSNELDQLSSSEAPAPPPMPEWPRFKIGEKSYVQQRLAREDAIEPGRFARFDARRREILRELTERFREQGLIVPNQQRRDLAWKQAIDEFPPLWDQRVTDDEIRRDMQKLRKQSKIANHQKRKILDEKLAASEDPDDDLRWVLGHSRILLPDARDTNMPLDSDELREAPSKLAIAMLLYYIKHPQELFAQAAKSFGKVEKRRRSPEKGEKPVARTNLDEVLRQELELE